MLYFSYREILSQLLLVIVLTGCEYGSDYETTSIVSYYKYDEIHSRDSLLYEWDIKPLFKKQNFLMKDGSQNFMISNSQNTNNDLFLIVRNHQCPISDTKYYDIDNDSILIKRYSYGNTGATDDESSICYSDRYGLLAVYDDAWGIFAFTIHYDETSLELVNVIVADTSRFYQRRPYPPSAVIP